MPTAEVTFNHPSQSLQDIFISYRQSLLDVATRIVGCRKRAEDVIQDAFLKLDDIAIEHVRQPVHYLFRLVRNLTLDWARRVSLELRYSGSEEETNNLCANCACPQSALIQHETLKHIDQALDELPPRTRLVFEMHRVDGYTQKEVAQHLGISPTLVNFMVRDAHAHCCAALKNYEENSCYQKAI